MSNIDTRISTDLIELEKNVNLHKSPMLIQNHLLLKIGFEPKTNNRL